MTNSGQGICILEKYWEQYCSGISLVFIIKVLKSEPQSWYIRFDIAVWIVSCQSISFNHNGVGVKSLILSESIIMSNLPVINASAFQVYWDFSDFWIWFYQDNLLDKHKANDNFGDGELQDTGRPLKSLVVYNVVLDLTTVFYLWW